MAARSALAVWLADQVGDGGSVDAFDIHDHNMAEAPNLRAEVHDIATDDLDPEEYDLVCCRSLMIHLADPKAALEKMVGALRPGGKLLVEEPDNSGDRTKRGGANLGQGADAVRRLEITQRTNDTPGCRPFQGLEWPRLPRWISVGTLGLDEHRWTLQSQA